MGVPEIIVAITTSIMLSTGIVPEKASFKETACLAEAVFFETSHRPVKEKEAVASVILNRKKSSRFPSDICDIVKQKGQFQHRKKRSIPNSKEKHITNIEQSSLFALKAVSEEGIKDRTGGATHFVNLESATDIEWLSGMRQTKKLGPHTFFIEPKKGNSNGSQKANDR